MKCFLLCLCITLCFTRIAQAASSNLENEEPTSCSFTIEGNQEWEVLSIRSSLSAGNDCVLTHARDLQALLISNSDLLTKYSYKELLIGRLVNHPWMVSYLVDYASKDKNWNHKQGKPVRGHENQYVANVLSRNDIILKIQTGFSGTPYRVKAASVEKVLIEQRPIVKYGDKDTGHLPFDAIVWFILESAPGK